MGAKYLGSYVGMARPILVERDYQAVKRLLLDQCKGIYVLLEAERFEALIRELTVYEDGSDVRDDIERIALQEPQPTSNRLYRRWSDPH